MTSQIQVFRIDGKDWHWNPFWGFFFLPVGPHRKRERIVKDGPLYDHLRHQSRYP